MDYSEISTIEFGVMSSDEIAANAVCLVTNDEITGPESVYDLRMGVIENGKTCPSCGGTNKTCPGHYGAIKLARAIFHPMFYRNIVAFLNVFCSTCSRLYVSDEHLKVEGCPKNYAKVCELVHDVGACYFCKCEKYSYSYVASESRIVRSQKDSKVPVSVDECLAIFSNILESDVELLGLKPSLIMPRNLIMEYLPVIPTRSRPYIISDGNVCDDDLTVVYQTVVKINRNLTADNMNTLIFHITSLMNNQDGKSKHNNGCRPIKGIKERISGKDGIIRNNMSGKRVNQSARTVIGPDPTLRTDEVAIPDHFAEKLTIPEHVNERNIHEMQQVVDNGRANYVLRNKNKINLAYACKTHETEILQGDTVMRNGRTADAPYMVGDTIHRNGEVIAYAPSVPRKYELRVGDTVERHLKDGDVVLINRQPTLHKCSMLAKKIVIRPGKTMRLNLATTKVFNADFDGDEMNIHVPQDYVARVEMQQLVSTSKNIISLQSSKPNVAVVQDGMLGAYLMTENDYAIPRHIFDDICMTVDFSFERMQTVLAVLPRCGRALVSLILPGDFTFEKEDFVIRDGILLKGSFTKSILSTIIHTLYKDYGTVLKFVDEIQFIVNGWLTHFGFSIGLKDCIPPAELGDEIKKNVARCFAEATTVNNTVSNVKIRDAKVAFALSKAKDMGMRAAKMSFTKENGFVSTVTSGSKGDYFNVCQITGLLGQQNVSCKRIQPVLNNGTRTLPHYPKKPVDDDFESGGFIQNSFIRGLKPQEFFFHSMSGREGVSDTALKTSVSGYTQRKMVKILEDVQVRYDGTVRNATGDIIQWSYANDGLDRSQTIPRGGHTDFCDISRLVHRLNAKVDKNY
jgi:DNA-directed RNA polymerase beta' subunit